MTTGPDHCAVIFNYILVRRCLQIYVRQMRFDACVRASRANRSACVMRMRVCNLYDSDLCM